MDYNKIVASGWNRDSGRYRKIYEAEFGRFINKRSRLGGSVLEIGCGRGELLLWLESCFERVVDVEKDAGMYKARVPYLRKNTHFCHMI